MNNKTLAIIKPKIIQDNKIGTLIKMIEQAQFKIKAIKIQPLTYQQAQKFYQIHKEKPFYHQLCTKMSSGQIIPMILQKENAVQQFRNLIGATNPQEAKKGTIRKELGTSIDDNAIHGSDSPQNAQIEINFFFPQTIN